MAAMVLTCAATRNNQIRRFGGWKLRHLGSSGRAAAAMSIGCSVVLCILSFS
jgi:hypothetical protein